MSSVNTQIEHKYSELTETISNKLAEILRKAKTEKAEKIKQTIPAYKLKWLLDNVTKVKMQDIFGIFDKNIASNMLEKYTAWQNKNYTKPRVLHKTPARH